MSTLRAARSPSSAPPPPSRRFARLCVYLFPLLQALRFPTRTDGPVTIRRAAQEPESSRAFIFEYDPRFANFGSAFVKYDFNFPEQIPEQLKGSCDYIMADPPYLNPDAVAKFARTIRLLARRPTEPEPEPEPEPAPAGDAEEGGKPGAAAGAAGAAGATAPAPVPVPVLYLSGAVTRDWVKEELGLRPNTFTPSFA